MKNIADMNYFFLVVGVIFLILAIFQLHRYKFWKKQVMVTGKVVDVSTSRGKYGSQYNLTYQYTDLKGIKNTASGSGGTSKEKVYAYRKGCRIKIYYDAKNTDHSIPFDRVGEFPTEAKLFFVIMLCYVFLGVIEAFV